MLLGNGGGPFVENEGCLESSSIVGASLAESPLPTARVFGEEGAFTYQVPLLRLIIVTM